MCVYLVALLLLAISIKNRGITDLKGERVNMGKKEEEKHDNRRESGARGRGQRGE